MTTKRVNRYYCDHCRKGGCNAGAIRRHESVCFFNPHRGCLVCGLERTEVALNVALLEHMTPDDLLKTGVCPACVCAAVAVFNKNAAPFEHDTGYSERITFEYQKALDEWNNQRAQMSAITP
jgi:hypothetical protein